MGQTIMYRCSVLLGLAESTFVHRVDIVLPGVGPGVCFDPSARRELEVLAQLFVPGNGSQSTTDRSGKVLWLDLI